MIPLEKITMVSLTEIIFNMIQRMIGIGRKIDNEIVSLNLFIVFIVLLFLLFDFSVKGGVTCMHVPAT